MPANTHSHCTLTIRQVYYLAKEIGAHLLTIRQAYYLNKAISPDCPLTFRQAYYLAGGGADHGGR